MEQISKKEGVLMTVSFNPPKEGTKITVTNGKLNVPNDPILPFIIGDGTGPDIWNATHKVLEAAVEKAYNGEKRIVWYEIFAGEKAFDNFGSWLPEQTLEVMREYKVGIKGPLTTPVGGGIRSLNVALRQELDLYSCVRPVRWLEGVPSPVKRPNLVDTVIFRENTEDVYSGVEWQQGTDEVKKVIDFLNNEMGKNIREDSGIGIKPISIFASKRLVRMAIEYAIKHNRSSVTLMHKGNIMKFTEGFFTEMGYELAIEEFRDYIVTEDELWEQFDGKVPEGKIVIKDRIADNMFQQILTRPNEYDVIATPNLNGDYISDALAAQVGGLGMAPGGNIGDEVALFEATHGTAPKYANKDKVNPGSLILSGVMMLEHLGWQEAADLVIEAMEKTITQGLVTYDLARQMENAKELKSSEFGQAIISNM